MKTKLIILVILCLCLLAVLTAIVLIACDDKAETLPPHTDVTTTIPTNLVNSASDAYEIAERDLRSRLGMQYHEIGYVDIADKKCESSICISTIYKIGDGNQYETFRSIDPDGGSGVIIVDIIEHPCYHVTFKGNASGYVDQYHDDYRRMLFTYNADVILSDGDIEYIDIDITWK